MQRKIFLFCLLLICGINFTFAQGKLTITPDKPVSLAPITISYSPEKNSSEQPVAILYIFNETQSFPVATDLPLKFDKKKNSWIAQITLPDDAVFGLAKVKSGKIFDTNKERFWDFYVYGKDGKMRQGAAMRGALSYFGSLPQNMKRFTDLAKTRELIELEVKNYPQNKQASIGLEQMKFEAKEISKQELEQRLSAVTSEQINKDKESEVRAVSRALRVINKSAQAAELDSIFKQKFPQSEYAEESEVLKLSNAESQEDFLALAVKFLSRFPSSVYAENIYNAVANTYLQLGQEGKLKRTLLNASYVPASVFNFMAMQSITEESNNPQEAMEWNDRALKQVGATNPFRPKYISEAEYQEMQNSSKGNILYTRGRILNRQAKHSEAVAAFSEARKILGVSSPKDLFSEYVESLSMLEKKKDAYDLASEAIRIDRANTNLLDLHKNLYSAVIKGDSLSYQAKLDELNALGIKERRLQLANTKLNQTFSIADKSLTTLDGKKITAGDLKGKVVLLDFWATWCGPCRSSFPSMQKLYERYKDKPNVAFAIVNVWERNPDRKGTVDEFLKKNPNLTFPVYFDEKDELARILGVTGIPTKFFLDKNGVVQFKEVGYVAEPQFLQESEDKIEVLLSEDK